MAVVGGGAQAELAVVHERTALPVPDALDLLEAGGFPEAFTVAHDALFTQCGLRPGERVLVNGAAGGVGIAGVQLALVAGATVVASVRAAHLREALEAFGAIGGRPGRCGRTRPLRRDLGTHRGAEPQDQPRLARHRRASRDHRHRRRCTWRDRPAAAHEPSRTHSRLHVAGSSIRGQGRCRAPVERQVLPLVAARRVRVPVEEVFALDDVEAAYARFAAGGKLGKIVLDIAGLSAFHPWLEFSHQDFRVNCSTRV